MCGGRESLLKALQKKTLRRFVAEITTLWVFGFFLLAFKNLFFFLSRLIKHSVLITAIILLLFNHGVL